MKNLTNKYVENIKGDIILIVKKYYYDVLEIGEYFYTVSTKK